MKRDLDAAKRAIADRIRFLMKASGLNANRLAKAMNKEPSNIHRILSGKQNLTLESIVELEGHLGGPVIEIVPPE